MRLFENELRSIEGIFETKGQVYESFEKGGRFGGFDSLPGSSSRTKVFSSTRDMKTVLLADKNMVPANIEDQLTKLFGVLPWRSHSAILGPHPDFKHLLHNQYENHYAVSMFADIKGSTRLSAKYPLPQVRLMKDAILSLAIYICNFFGGHIQRLQGDGIFVYFVGRDVHRNDAVISALNAASVLAQFISTDLASSFRAMEIDPLRIRMGIDYGDDDTVLWSHYGIPNCSELTTTSLHTDLAAKLQAEAPSNGIMIGNNIKDKLDLPSNYLRVPTVYDSSSGSYKAVADPYIFQGPPKYRYWEFDWHTYLKTFDFMIKDSNGKDLKIEEPSVRIKCEYTFNEQTKIYPQNLFSIPKGGTLNFTLVNQYGNPYIKAQNENISWEVTNTGAEAAAKQDLKHNLQGHYDNGVKATANTAYLGHHQIQCKIVRYNGNVYARHFVFVQ
ncbi:nucleotide-binding domain-containing protein [Adhaeribacter aquaticus]|uniref:nucleotide-binding domain-containing protein n=1 Tax=Adhaeribacter aquaticus TaxID=299567 RepID=UPI0003FC639E|nr:adenylate/guanylate cyclase domain-containing protein [Adhaeribacter aquaticus]